MTQTEDGSAGRVPVGRTSAKWFAEGYQAALRDLRQQFEDGGEGAARSWIENNITLAPGSVIPDQPGYVVGTCGHRLARSEWRAGFRACERC